MKHEAIESKFLDYLENQLSVKERHELEQELASSAELRQALADYQAIVAGEKTMAASESAAGEFKLNSNFEVKVMQRIDSAESGFLKELIMKVIAGNRYALSSVAGLALLALVVKVSWETQQQVKPLSLPLPAKVEEPVVAELKSKNPSTAKVTSQAVLQPQPQALKKNEFDLSNSPVEFGLMLKGDPAGSAGNHARSLNTESIENDSTNSITINSIFPEKRTYAPEQNSAHYSTAPAGGSYSVEIHSSTQPVNPQSGDLRRQNTEKYQNYGENQRVQVSTEAVSTFSIDVDTGSYTNSRRFLRSGILPPTDAIRIEEFINYFDYQYPVQREKPFNLSYEIAPSPLEQDRFLLKLGIKARDLSQSEKPWNLVFLIDTSGSMEADNKLGLVKRSLKLLTNKMRQQDKIALVTYAGSAGLVLDATGIGEREKINSAIENLAAGGSTYGSGGINLAYDVARRNFVSGAVNRVILATDGDFNVGVTSTSELLKIIEEKRQSGITLTTLGFGVGNYQEVTMEQLANKGNGNYFYIDSFDEARKVFETDLVGTIEVVAKDVKLQIEFNSQHVQQYRLIGYENRKLEKQDFNNDAIDAGEIGAGHTVTALYEIILTNSALAQQLNTESRYQQPAKAEVAAASAELSRELAFLKVRFKQPESQQSELLTFTIAKADLKQSIAETSDDFRFAAAVSCFAHKLRRSSYAGSYSFSEIQKLAEGARGADAHGYRQELIELIKNAKAIAGEG